MSTRTERPISSTPACARASPSMGSGSGHRTATVGRRDPTMPWSRSSRLLFRFARGKPLLRGAPERTARVRVLVHQRRHPSRGNRDIHGPTHAEHAIGEDLIGLRIPVGLAETLEGRQAEVVRHHAGNLPMPGPFGVGLLELLIESAEESQPDRGPREPIQIFHLDTTSGAGVVPGCVARFPFAQSGHSEGVYEAISRLQRAWTGTSRRAAPPDRSTRTDAPTTVPPAARTAAMVSWTDPPVVMMSSTTSTRSPGERANPRRNSRPVAPSRRSA